MPAANIALHALNRGMLSRKALTRTQLPRYGLSAEVQTNFMPSSLGPASLRCGTEHTGNSRSNNRPFTIPFTFSTTDIADVEVTNQAVRVWVDDTVIQRSSVSSAITNGLFNLNITSWTDDSGSGSSTAWSAGGYAKLTGSGQTAAKLYQEVTVASGDQGTEHGIAFDIERGPVTLRIGSTAGAEDYFSATTLRTGTHSIAITPTGNFFIHFESFEEYSVLVDSVAIESSGDMVLTAPWLTADLRKLRYEGSGNVIFVACSGYKQRRIERHSTRSWSVVEYQAVDGPYRLTNTSSTTIAPSALTGDITLTASQAFFNNDMVGGLISWTSLGQRVEETFTAASQASGYIRVVGSDAQRIFTLDIEEDPGGTGTWEITLQRSVAEPGAWVNYKTYTTDQNEITVDDSQDEQIIYYRLFVSDWSWDSDVDVFLDYDEGEITGHTLITGYTSSILVSAVVLSPLGGTDATASWAEGEWSDHRGWPSSVGIFESRLFWAGKDKFWGSVTDIYASFDSEDTTAQGPLNRSVGFGPVDNINWLLPLQRILAGSDGDVLSVQTSSDNQPLTPTNFVLRGQGSLGSAQVAARKVNQAGLFVSRSGVRIYELTYALEDDSHIPTDITLHVPEIGESPFVRIEVQREPDTRVHCVREDGKVGILLYNRAEDLLCWILYETDGEVVDVHVQPGSVEDQVYYTVCRTIDGDTKYYREKWSMESACYIWSTEYHSDTGVIRIEDLKYADGTLVTVRDENGDKIENLTVSDKTIVLSSAVTYALITPSICKSLDSFTTYSGTATTTITDLSHLEGKTVAVWGDGAYQGTYQVDEAQITGLAESVEEAVIGLPFTSDFESVKLAYADGTGSALIAKKRVPRAGVVLQDTHHKGLEYGPTFDRLDEMPQVYKGNVVTESRVYHDYDDQAVMFPGEWDTDSRICLRATAPKPCTVLAIVTDIDTKDRV